jgi:hypothetical protein
MARELDEPVFFSFLSPPVAGTENLGVPPGRVLSASIDVMDYWEDGQKYLADEIDE